MYFDWISFSAPVLLLILKWGGEATSVGLNHAKELGKAFRCMYPREYSNLLGSGLVRLHNLYHHNVKVILIDNMFRIKFVSIDICI